MKNRNNDKNNPEVLIFDLIRPKERSMEDFYAQDIPYFIERIAPSEKGVAISLIMEHGQQAGPINFLNAGIKFFDKIFIFIDEGWSILTPDGYCRVECICRDEEGVTLELLTIVEGKRLTLRITQRPSAEIAQEVKATLLRATEGTLNNIGDRFLNILSCFEGKGGDMEAAFSGFREKWEKLEISELLRDAANELKKKKENQK